MLQMDDGLSFRLPGEINHGHIFINISEAIFKTTPSDDVGEINVVSSSTTDTSYDQFLADVWVGIVLTMMVVSCVCFMCSCLIYHKFQQWKNRVLATRTTANVESGPVESDLPSYTIASGLPSYEEALEQLKKVRVPSVHNTSNKSDNSSNDNWVPRTPPTPISTLSVVNLFQFYKNTEQTASVGRKPS